MTQKNPYPFNVKIPLTKLNWKKIKSLKSQENKYFWLIPLIPSVPPQKDISKSFTTLIHSEIKKIRNKNYNTHS